MSCPCSKRAPCPLGKGPIAWPLVLLTLGAFSRTTRTRGQTYIHTVHTDSPFFVLFICSYLPTTDLEGILTVKDEAIPHPGDVSIVHHLTGCPGTPGNFKQAVCGRDELEVPFVAEREWTQKGDVEDDDDDIERTFIAIVLLHWWCPSGQVGEKPYPECPAARRCPL